MERLHIHWRTGLRHCRSGALVWKKSGCYQTCTIVRCFKEGSIIRCFFCKIRQLTAEMPLGNYWLVSNCSNGPLVVDCRLPAGQPHTESVHQVFVMNGDHHDWTAFTRICTRLSLVPACLTFSKISAGLLLPIVLPCFEAGVNQPETLYTDNFEVWRTSQGKKSQ